MTETSSKVAVVKNIYLAAFVVVYPIEEKILDTLELDTMRCAAATSDDAMIQIDGDIIHNGVLLIYISIDDASGGPRKDK